MRSGTALPNLPEEPKSPFNPFAPLESAVWVASEPTWEGDLTVRHNPPAQNPLTGWRNRVPGRT